MHPSDNSDNIQASDLENVDFELAIESSNKSR